MKAGVDAPEPALEHGGEGSGVAQAAAQGAEAQPDVNVRLLPPVEAQPADVLAADGYIFATPEMLAVPPGVGQRELGPARRSLVSHELQPAEHLWPGCERTRLQESVGEVQGRLAAAREDQSRSVRARDQARADLATAQSSLPL